MATSRVMPPTLAIFSTLLRSTLFTSLMFSILLFSLSLLIRHYDIAATPMFIAVSFRQLPLSKISWIDYWRFTIDTTPAASRRHYLPPLLLILPAPSFSSLVSLRYAVAATTIALFVTPSLSHAATIRSTPFTPLRHYHVAAFTTSITPSVIRLSAHAYSLRLPLITMLAACRDSPPLRSYIATVCHCYAIAATLIA